MATLPVIAGFHCCNNNAPTGKDHDIIRMTEAGAITFLTGMGQRFSVDDVKWVLSINPNCHFFLREYLDPNRIGNRHNRSTWNYTALDKYFDECKYTLSKYYAANIPDGQKHFQLFNEQNMPTWAQWEGFGDTPDDMKRFNEWFVRGVEKLRVFSPSTTFGLTPLTPGNRDAWFEGDPRGVHYYLHGPEGAQPNANQGQVWAARESCLCKEAIDIADEYYFHIYVHETRDPAGKHISVDHHAYGLRYRRFLWFLPQKPYWLLECGYPNAGLWKGDARLLNWLEALDQQANDYRPDGVTFWILGEKEDWGNMFAPGGQTRPFVYDLKKYLNEREEVVTPTPEPEPEPEPTKIEIHYQESAYDIGVFKHYLSRWEPFAEITEVFVHHTVNPTPETWRGRESMLAMKRVYKQKGWTAGPHIFVAPDGIWVFTPVNKQGVGCVGHNDHAIHVEIVGNYQKEALEGVMQKNAINAFAAICLWLNYDPLDLCLHREYGNTVCPGKHLTGYFRFQVMYKIFRHEAAKRIGTEPIRINEDAALYKWRVGSSTRGAPLTNEFECCGHIVQGFAGSILSAQKGKWQAVYGTEW